MAYCGRGVSCGLKNTHALENPAPPAQPSSATGAIGANAHGMTVASTPSNRFERASIMTPDIKRILVPLDFSDNSNRALDYAHGLALKPSRASSPGLSTVLARAVGAAVLAAMLLMPATASAQEEAQLRQTTAGATVFSTYCASCHGTSARGDGPLASAMRRKPANLLEIAKRNGGVFPSEIVFKTIDGRQPVRGHGGPDMPVWGDVFAKSREAGDADRVTAVIQSLVQYLETIQLRSSQDPQR
jgi:mono/diheme cytochrome c family protein